MLADGSFREDLFYRLNVVSLQLPTLAERREDIPLLAQHFLNTLAARHGRRIRGFAPDALRALATAAWPGNVRQLHNVVEQVVRAGHGTAHPADFGAARAAHARGAGAEFCRGAPAF